MLSPTGFFVCVAYMFVGPALILLNQYILKTLNFPYPMFLSGLGVFSSGLFAQALVRLGHVQVEKPEAVQGILWYKRVLPVGLAQAATLSFGNTVYLFLNVGFIQMLKSFTPVCIMITAYAAGIEIPSLHLVISVSIISIGTAITCGFSADFNVWGIFLMFMAEFTESIKLVFTQFLLQNVKMGVVESQLVLAPAAAFWLFVASAFYEFPTMIEKEAFSILVDSFFYFFAASCMGIGVNFISNLVIQHTSSLTMKILNVARNVGTIMIGILFYAEVVGGKEAVGYFIALIGFAMFNAVKMGYIGEKSHSPVIKLEEHANKNNSVIPSDRLLLNPYNNHIPSSNLEAGGGGGNGLKYGGSMDSEDSRVV